MSDTVPPLELRLFGPFHARLHGRPLPPLRSRRGQWLLTLLALRHDREVEREWLAGTLWPDSDTPQALSSLRRALTDLRHVLGDQAGRLHSPTPHTLRLDLRGSRVDVFAFDTALLVASESALAQAVDLYGGPLLEGCSEDWILSEREERELAYLAALERLAERAQARQDHAQAVHWLRLVLVVDPLRETAQRSLMQALAQQGAIGAATQVYRDFRLFLSRQMNVAPDPQTTALYDRLRASARDLALRPLSAPPTPMRPPADNASPRHLPRPLTPFVGRQKQIRDLVAQVLETRILSLVGAGGIGKTRLAIRVAEEVADDFVDGVWFVDLSGLSDGALVAQALATMLEVREEAQQTLVETLAQYLAQKSVLLILDNCEHVIEACSYLALRLAQDCARLHLLATSRQSLGVAGERVWRVPPLSVPLAPGVESASLDAEDLASEFEAIRLFVERARAALPTFALTERSIGPTVQICCRLDGIPLALELAAARVNVLLVEEIARRLDDRFRLLTLGNRTAPHRQQTLRAAIDWSYDLLSEQERLLLGRLSVFAGGWSVEAAEQIGADEEGKPSETNVRIRDIEVLDLLAQLIDRSLVTVDGTEAGASRYRIMESIREYARERLHASGEEPVLRDRHRVYFAGLSVAAEQQLAGPDQATWLERLEKEHDNLRTALEACIHSDTGLLMACSLWRFWYVRGFLREASEWFRAGLEHGGEDLDPFIRAKSLLRAGIFAWAQNRIQDAAAYYSASLRIFREMHNETGIASALSNLGTVAHFQEDFHRASQYYQEAIDILRGLGKQMDLAASLLNLGAVLHTLGDLERAGRLHEESLTIRRELGDESGIASTLGGLAHVYIDQGDFIMARRCLTEKLDISKKLNDRLGLVRSLETEARFASAQDDPLRATRLFGLIEKVRETMGAAQSWSVDPGIAASIKQAEAALGGSAFADAWAQGRSMEMDEVIERILADSIAYAESHTRLSWPLNEERPV